VQLPSEAGTRARESSPGERGPTHALSPNSPTRSLAPSMPRCRIRAEGRMSELDGQSARNATKCRRLECRSFAWSPKCGTELTGMPTKYGCRSIAVGGDLPPAPHTGPPLHRWAGVPNQPQHTEKAQSNKRRVGFEVLPSRPVASRPSAQNATKSPNPEYRQNTQTSQFQEFGPKSPEQPNSA
jgi:hypothetical protein